MKPDAVRQAFDAALDALAQQIKQEAPARLISACDAGWPLMTRRAQFVVPSLVAT